jgi:hypothetical protein
MENYSAIKRNKLVTPTKAWMLSNACRVKEARLRSLHVVAFHLDVIRGRHKTAGKESR